MRFVCNSCCSLTIVSLAVFLASCAGVRRMQEDISNSREKDKKAFVEKKDGQIIEGDEMKLRSPIFGKSTIEIDGSGEKIPVKEIAAYQNSYAYYRTTPVGFAPRFKKGLINLYVGTTTYTEYQAPSSMNGGFGGSRTRSRPVYYIQKGNSGGVELFSSNLVESYVADYAPAMDFMNDYNQMQKKVSRWSVINTTAVLGGIVLAGTVGTKNDKVTAAGYGGLGLFLGGLVNGFVNKVRRGKNTKNLELAIDTYNSQTKKKGR